MQNFHSFFTNYPPPSRELLINEGLKTFEQNKLDQQWLNNWIERKKQNKLLSSSNQMTLSDYRQKLIYHAQLLQQYEHALNNSNYEILFELKIKIEQSNNFIYDENRIKNMKKKIQQRKSKRKRLQRQKQEKFIDIKQNSIESKVNNEKSVNEKIQDINSLIQTIEKLKQLKTIRQQQNDDINGNTINELTEIHNLCTSKLLEYQTEMENKSHCSHIDLYNYLFNNHNQSFYESINSDAQYFLRAHQNLNDLVTIRQAWDQYSTTHISSMDNIISYKWHEPQLPSDSNWTQYIFNNEQ
ncbi:unnamed protein product [Adineta steineri]|uniref:Uncharacterized protein n=1 Tax=Adineta steineri TaxID=433720 RepID=A0A815FPC8_9BILA|nr:unnamed protein product [Adineta steineri]